MADRLSADVVVVGAGPAGIGAAVHAAAAGARVLVLDEAPRAGGSIWRARGGPPPTPARWLERLTRSGAPIVTGASVVDAPSPRRLLVDRGGAATVVEYDRLVLATGARELFLPFPGWTRPGVVGAGGRAGFAEGRRDVRRPPGRRCRHWPAAPGRCRRAAGGRGARRRHRRAGPVRPARRVRGGTSPFARRRPSRDSVTAHGSSARRTARAPGCARRSATDALEGVMVTDGRREHEWPCDVLACGFGLVANLELPRLLGCETGGRRRRRRRGAADARCPRFTRPAS